MVVGTGDASLRPSLPYRVGALVTHLALLLVILSFYSWFRKTYFQADAEVAFGNALDIIRWQAPLGLNIELDLQRRVLGWGAAIDFFNAHYRQFKPVLFVAAGLAILQDRPGFTRVWRLFLVTTALAFPMYALYPLAPPRFMAPYGYPFVDTLAAFGATPNATTGLAAANQFAAMPSMHVAWTAIAALWLVVALPRWRAGAILGGAHLATMCVTVMVTGNHYVLDVVGGFATVGLAWAILALTGRFLGRQAPGRRPVTATRGIAAPSQVDGPSLMAPGESRRNGAGGEEQSSMAPSLARTIIPHPDSHSRRR